MLLDSFIGNDNKKSPTEIKTNEFFEYPSITFILNFDAVVSSAKTIKIPITKNPIPIYTFFPDIKRFNLLIRIAAGT